MSLPKSIANARYIAVLVVYSLSVSKTLSEAQVLLSSFGMNSVNETVQRHIVDG